jgi:histone H3/H4
MKKNEKLTDLLKWHHSAINTLDKLIKDIRHAIAEEAKRRCHENNQALIDSETVCQAMKKYVKPEFYDPYADSLSSRGD